LTSRKQVADQNEKLTTAPLPQKNAVSPPASESAKHKEHLMDKALEDTFPASDPTGELPDVSLGEESEEERHEECLLDEALEETFPASDPIAVHTADKLSRAPR
jgi:hypothetical protein